MPSSANKIKDIDFESWLMIDSLHSESEYDDSIAYSIVFKMYLRFWQESVCKCKSKWIRQENVTRTD